LRERVDVTGLLFWVRTGLVAGENRTSMTFPGAVADMHGTRCGAGYAERTLPPSDRSRKMMAWLVAAVSAPALLVGPLPVHSGASDRPPVPVHRVAGHSVRLVESPGRAVFNDPLGSGRRQFALIRHINAKIDGAGRSSVVRLAAYSFAMPSTAQALLRAHRRGAAVKVVVDAHSARWGSVRNLRRQLGGDRHHRSFVLVCRHSCRGTAGNQHAKFVTISRTGRHDDLVMVGSMNFTAFAAAGQWQDLYSVAGNTRLYRQLVRVFRQMTRDRAQPRLRLQTPGEGFRTEVAPVAGTGVEDPVGARLGAVRCGGAAGGHHRTVVRISMHAWNGDRGVRLAKKVAGLRRAGCSVRVLAGVGVGRHVATVLRRARVGYRAAGPDDPATHQKLMLVSGRFGRSSSASYVWTGSHNWTDRSLRNDEVTLRVAGARRVAAYRANFDRIWRAYGR
jgi:phosphatidylserine/phosphatidylglycerophosphate/cardiolipin synthase-like enzyme